MPELVPAVPLTPEWHAARRGGVTATDIVTILGLNTWDSVYSLFWRKMQQAPEVEDNDRFRLGRELEPYIAERWRAEHRGELDERGGLYRHSSRPWQMATPDRIVLLYDVEGDTNATVPLGPKAVLEVKTWADADKHSWQDGLPARVRAQVLWQMDVMDVATGHVGVVFLPSGEFRSYTIEHEDCDAFGEGNSVHCPACADQYLMVEAGEEFMARLRLELPPPDPDSSAATLAAVRARFTRQPDKQADVDREIFLEWLDAKNVIAEYEDRQREFEIKMREQAGEASVLCVDGQPAARRIIVDAQVKAHTRHQDYLKRINQGDGDA